MRSRGALLVVGCLMVVAVGALALLSQQPAEVNPLAPVAVGKALDISRVPVPVPVNMRQGADRILQRERSALGECTTQTMGCPASLKVRAVTVFLVRDDANALHAFIGEDPRNGCALEWLSSVSAGQVMGVFHDVCHGSFYDRRGQRVGGPSPWNLNELATSTRGDVIWVEPDHIVVGGHSTITMDLYSCVTTTLGREAARTMGAALFG
jgi:Rieske Fe-S protein